jgi:spermidine synthase
MIRVVKDAGERFHILYHGRAVHGAQHLDPNLRRVPLNYYTASGPIGQVFAALSPRMFGKRIGVVGLGAGTMAVYGLPGQLWDFYEIDPAVEAIARETRYFTYLAMAMARVRVIIGDARLRLADAPDASYALFVTDAFSSDSIPVHLLTRENLRLLVAKLADGGVLAFNISNRYLDLEPVLAHLARDAGLVCLAQEDESVGIVDEIRSMKSRSVWAVMARSREDLGVLADSPRWHPARATPGAAPWTDDYSNILSVFTKWR